MAINIKTPKAALGAHGEGAVMLETEVASTTTSKAGGKEEIIDQQYEHTSEPVHPMPTPYETVTVGMAFKLPIAQYTMLEFSVYRSVPFDPLQGDADTTFDQTHAWVESKLNAMIEEQQQQQTNAG